MAHLFFYLIGVFMFYRMPQSSTKRQLYKVCFVFTLSRITYVSYSFYYIKHNICL